MEHGKFFEVTRKFNSPTVLLEAYHDGELQRKLVIDVLEFSMVDYFEDEITGFITLN